MKNTIINEIRKDIIIGIMVLCFMKREELMRWGLNRNIKNGVNNDMKYGTVWLRNTDYQKVEHQKVRGA